MHGLCMQPDENLTIYQDLNILSFSLFFFFFIYLLYSINFL